MTVGRLARSVAASLALAGCSAYVSGLADTTDTTDAGPTVRSDAALPPADAGPPDADILHVSVRGTDLGADGSRERPFRSLAAALSLAGTARPAGAEIHVCQGDYEEARLVVRTPLRIEGSFDCSTWTRGSNPEVSETVVRGVDPAAEALLDIDVADGAPVHVAALSLLGVQGATARGASTLVSTGGSVLLRDLRIVSPTGTSVRAALLYGGQLTHSSLATQGGTAVDHFGSMGLTVARHAVRVEDVSIEVQGARCVGLEMGAGLEVELRSTTIGTEGCTDESLVVGGSAESFDSSGSVFFARSPVVTKTVHGVLLQGVKRVRSVGDRVLAQVTAPSTTTILGVVVESTDAQLDNLLVGLASVTAIGVKIQNTVRVRHATVALLGTTTGSAIEFPDRAAGPRMVDSSLLLCLGCSADASARQAFAWPTAQQVQNNMTRGFTRDSVRTDASGIESFATWSPSNVAVPCADAACSGTVMLPADYTVLRYNGLPLADTAPCAIATSASALLEPALDAVGTTRTAAASVGAHEHDGACAP